MVARRSNERPGVDGPGGDLVALLAGHQAGLAGERGFVEDGRIPDDHPVDGHHFAGADREQVTGYDGLDRGRVEPAIVISLDVPRCPSEQRRQFAVRAALRVALQRLAGREHDGDDRRGERLAEQKRADDGQDRDEIDAELAAREIADDRPCESHRDHDRRDRPGEISRVGIPRPRQPDPGQEPCHGHRQHGAVDEVASPVDRARRWFCRGVRGGAGRRGGHRASLWQGSPRASRPDCPFRGAIGPTRIRSAPPCGKDAMIHRRRRW